MALDPELACPDCRRFWHGPAGYIPHWYAIEGYEGGGGCTNPRHAKPYASEVAARKIDPRLQEAYEIGFKDDRYATGRLGERFSMVTGEAHRHMMGLSLAAEQLVGIETGRRWLNQPGEGGDVEGLNVRWTHHDGGCLPIAQVDTNQLPYVLVTGGELERLVVRGWAYHSEVCLPVYWRSDWPYPVWCGPQRILRPLSTIPPLGGDPWLTVT